MGIFSKKTEDKALDDSTAYWNAVEEAEDEAILEAAAREEAAKEPDPVKDVAPTDHAVAVNRDRMDLRKKRK